ncbi:fungal-specific transcription factor domain-containing protein [Aspergillus minisclerotigenes]|uniref:Fungal-specific transcription factor domain-containing protein n=1 Tax=Aspergillus minisclerotigenes TaxID=656917 RepID=A0A5N6JAD6_9EURO|nr:fungal-specific transcription factor domain-containing protein [Aspergillus minisclerotigenes]
MLDGHPHRALVQDRVCAATGARSDVTVGFHVPIVPGRAGHIRQSQGRQDTPGSNHPVPPKPKARTPTALEHRPSKPWELLLGDGQRVHYVNNSNLKDLLYDEEHMRPPSTDHPTVSPAEQGVSGNGPDRLAISPLDPGLHHLHPEPRDALQLWAIYVKNVDPVAKILHIPTAQSAIIATILDPKNAGKSMSALMFAIYFAALTSMNEQDAADLSLNRVQLLEHFKSGLSHILVGTELLNQPDMPALQALAIFLTSLRVHETGRGVWVLNGIAIRLAQSIGLHRDGTSLNLTPFESELRLRVWWHLCMLDARSPEDHGFELTDNLLNHGPRLPLNVNDDQLYLTMEELPTESEEWTEMSFSLEGIKGTRLLHSILGTRSKDTLDDIAAKRRTIEDYKNWLDNILSSSHSPDHLSNLAYRHYITACKKMEFLLLIREEIYQEKQARVRSGPDYSTRPSFKAARDVLESSYILLQDSGPFRQYTWLFKTYTQWYALAYVLRCLCTSRRTLENDRVWDLVNDILQRATNFDPSSNSCATIGNSSIWRCLCSLRAQALSARLAQQSPMDPHPLPPHLGSQEIDTSNDKTHNQNRNSTQPGESSLTTDNVLSINNPVYFDDPIEQSFEDLPDTEHDFFPASSLFEVPCLPGWNAVINGILDDDYI